MWRSIECIVYVLSVVGAAELPGRKWLQQSSGYLQQGAPYTFKGHVRGHLDCSWRCSESRSFFYTDGTGDCQCHDDTYTTSDVGMMAVPNVRYFERQELSKMPCPASAAVPTDVFRSGDTLFTVRPILDQARTFDDAQAACVTNGGYLFKVNTLEKFHIAFQLITECSAYTPYDFWVNGVTIGTTNVFETLDGELIPMTADFWAPDMPDQTGNRCIWMWDTLDFMLDDRPCGHYVGYEAYALFEMPQ